MAGDKQEDRDAWAAAAVDALRSIKVEGETAAAPQSPEDKAAEQRPPMTAREWIRLRDQRALDAAYTQNAAASIALARLIAKKGGK